MDNSKRIVVVTGFEPFGAHTINASWVAVQELKKLGLGKDVDLHVYEVPVEYQAVQSLVPSLWKQYHPQLVVHVGVSGMATTVTLEKCGRNHGYKGLDNSRFCPHSQCCIEGGPDCIDSVIDMESVCKRVTASGLGVAVSVSKDAGSFGHPAAVPRTLNLNDAGLKGVSGRVGICKTYIFNLHMHRIDISTHQSIMIRTIILIPVFPDRYLCDFTYYTSLYLSHGRSAFVHVPPIAKPYSGEDLGRALQAIIQEMLDMLDRAEEMVHCQHVH